MSRVVGVRVWTISPSTQLTTRHTTHYPSAPLTNLMSTITKQPNLNQITFKILSKASSLDSKENDEVVL